MDRVSIGKDKCNLISMRPHLDVNVIRALNIERLRHRFTKVRNQLKRRIDMFKEQKNFINTKKYIVPSGRKMGKSSLTEKCNSCGAQNGTHSLICKKIQDEFKEI